MPSIGGLIATIEPKGSRYAVAGVLRGWMPVPPTAQAEAILVLSVDGQEAARFPVSYAGAPLPIGGGHVARYPFEVVLPEGLFGRTARIDLRSEDGRIIGIPGIVLRIAENGDGYLAELNDGLRELADQARSLVQRGKSGNAYVFYSQVCCTAFMADHASALMAARAAADIFDRRAADILVAPVIADLPTNYGLLSRLGKILLKLDRFDEAMACFDRAVAIDPAQFDACNGRIKAHIGRSDWHSALLEAHRLRQNLAPDSKPYADLSGTIAWLYLNVSQPDTALIEALAARKLHPEDTRLMQMHADALVRLARYDEAIAIYRQALAPRNKDPLLRKRIATALMLAGEFAESGDQDSGRISTPTFAKLNNLPENIPLWRGELQLPGKLLVWAEVNFGVGQNLMHASLLPGLLELGVDVILEVEARLVPVFAAAFPGITVLAQVGLGQQRGDWLADVSHQVPIGSLARLFRRSRSDFALARPFLSHNPERTQALRRELLVASNGRRILVGFSWTSTNPYVGDDKTVPLPELLEALNVPGVALVNLQYGEHAQAIASAAQLAGVDVLEARDIDRTDDLVGMCDLIAGLDLVVCIGHTTAHLAGGLGVPNLVLVPSSPFQHWLGAGEDCVWYPNSRILRQPVDQRGNWAEPLGQAQQYLAARVLGLDVPPLQGGTASEGRGATDNLAAFLRNSLGVAVSVYEYELAQQLIRAIEEKRGNDPDLLMVVGDSHFRMGNFEQALNAYQAAMACGADPVAGTTKRVDVLLECYQLAGASALMRELFKADPALEESRPDLVLLDSQILASLDRLVLAIERVRPLVERDPGNAEAALTLANLYTARGEHEKSRSLLTRTLKTVVEPDLIVALGIAIGRAGQPKVACKMLDVAARRMPRTLATFWRGQFNALANGSTDKQSAGTTPTLPDRSHEKVTVFVCMDTVYCLQYLGSIAASLIANSPGANLHVHLVNPDEAALNCLKAVEEMLGPDRFSHGIETMKFVGYNVEQRKTYFASIRFVRLAELMRRAHGTYFVMDVDNIIRGDLSGCIGLARQADVLIRRRFSMSPHLAVAACGILLGNTEAARAFMDRTAEYILNAVQTRNVAWYLDQIALTISLDEGKSAGGLLRVAQLPTELLDWDFAAESVIWTGKGKRRLSNQRYQSEYRRYVDMFERSSRVAA